MDSCSLPTTDSFPVTAAAPPAESLRYTRVAETYAFRDGGFPAWRAAQLVIIGAGLVGSRLAEEAVMSGVGGVTVIDPDVGQMANLGNQRCRVGVSKVATVVDRCAALRPGCAQGLTADVRHVGVRQLQRCHLWFDCTDDPNLAWPLTELSNGLTRPLLRCAVDGSGEMDLARVLCSHGGANQACQLCSYSLPDLLRRRRRAPCMKPAERPATRAGGGMGALLAGLALSLAQRLIAGRGAEEVLNSEVLVDLTNFQLLRLRLQRSAQCLSGHRRWDMTDWGRPVEQTPLEELFAAAQREAGDRLVRLTAYLHPWNVQAYCACGRVQEAVGTDWAVPPACPACGTPMQWLTETQLDRLSRQQAAEWDILDRPLSALGIPAGAMFLVRSPGRPVRRWLLP